jgi:hypothetical protein
MPRSFYYIYRIEIMDARYALFFALFIYFSFVLIQPRDEACNVMLYTAMWTHVSIINAARTIFNYFRIFARASWLLGQDDVQKMLMSLTSSFVGVLGRFSSPSSLQGMVVSHTLRLHHIWFPTTTAMHVGPETESHGCPTYGGRARSVAIWSGV